jgi:hypothetical protein
MVCMNTGKFEIEKSHPGPYFRVLRQLQGMVGFLPDTTDSKCIILPGTFISGAHGHRSSCPTDFRAIART